MRLRGQKAYDFPGLEYSGIIIQIARSGFREGKQLFVCRERNILIHRPWRRVAGMHILRQETIYRFPALAIVIVLGVDMRIPHVLCSAVEAVDLLDRRKFLYRSMARPIVS